MSADEIRQRVTDAAIDAAAIRAAMDRIERAQNSNQTVVSVNAGGVGLWIAVTCCIVSFVINAAIAVAFLSHDREIERLQDYLAVIYSQAPHLKPADEKEAQ